ncbi:DEAD/DEAH box helicase [Cellulomonas algicola]|uniref:DEAD/DEAH box helicase family protein n=1 Tax=Cellulomonas algicola TaxID=2071633 RepID=UPI001C3F9EF8|nr:DEAD/DEAH box helicase family protein [Cellulomonas algicola]
MSGYYKRRRRNFAYWPSDPRPGWRESQQGALGALIAHWSIRPLEPALLSLPTGAGKSAIATAVPHLSGASRVLVVVPSRHLRDQMVETFSRQGVLREIGAVSGPDNPDVRAVTGLVKDWAALTSADVVVGLPASLSPLLYDTQPPSDLFDLVIMDEAHHAPARSWHAILEHYAQARRVLLTATPWRRDGQRVPGEQVFHYPLAKAIADGDYRPVRATLVGDGSATSIDHQDASICEKVMAVLDDPSHASSTLLVRASTQERAHVLAQLYTEAGRPTVVLTNLMKEKDQAAVVAGLHDGSVKSVAVVSMLGEGFDLPSFRVVGYHDKHRSIVATTQLIGRLVRHSASYPQQPVLVTARGSDASAGLADAVTSLYAEDADWAQLLPDLLDEQAEKARAERTYLDALAPSPAELSVADLRIPVRAVVYETHVPAWSPDFTKAVGELEPGSVVAGSTEIFYAALTTTRTTLVMVTRRVESPRWHAHPGLDSHRFELHVITWVPPEGGAGPGLLFINSTDHLVRQLLEKRLGTAAASLRPASPESLHGAFDALTRLSVSNVGVRNTNVVARQGSASYKTFTGSGVDRGLREVDTASGAIGHAMARVSGGAGSYTAGIAIEKAKMWESRYLSLIQYEDAIARFASRYRSSDVAYLPLLPAVSRGRAVRAFPDEPGAAEWHPDLMGGDRTYAGEPVEYMDLRMVWEESTSEKVVLELRQRQDDVPPLWRGEQALDGQVVDTDGSLSVRRGAAYEDLADLLSEFPPTLRFACGTTVVGAVEYERPSVRADLAHLIKQESIDWSGVNIKTETDRSASEARKGISVQARIQSHLRADSPRLPHRWVLHNDGQGEFADLLVLETDVTSQVYLELWHLKPSMSRRLGTRVKDIELVGAQAAKSRRWFIDPGFYAELGARLRGKAPVVTVISGNVVMLHQLLANPPKGRSRPGPLVAAAPPVRGEIVIVQPGLSWGLLKSRLDRDPRSLQQTTSQDRLSAQQTRDLLSVVGDAVGNLADVRVVASR